MTSQTGRDEFYMDDETSGALGGVKFGDAIELPFLAPALWVLNGDTRLQVTGGAQYYGGFATKRDDFTEFDLEIPQNFKMEQLATSDGKVFDAFTARFVIVAPIGSRVSWIANGLRFSTYTPGARQHAQVLAYMAVERVDGQTKIIKPWGPVILTAKGYQATNLIKSFQAWKKHIASPAKQIAPKVPPFAFYAAVGTFGDTPHFEQVGSGANTSRITPISSHLPKNVDREFLLRRFVGNETAREMVSLQEQAGEWLQAWKDLDAPTPGQRESAFDAPGYSGSDGAPEPPENWNASDDDLPF